MPALEEAIKRDEYLREQVYYRFFKEIAAVVNANFEILEIDTGALIRARLDMMEIDSVTKRWGAKAIRLLEGRALQFLVTYLKAAAFVIRNPIKNALGQ